MKRTRTKSRAPREHGRHYTPAELARRIVRAGLAAAEAVPRTDPLRVLDPACGAGAFLLEVFDELAERMLGSARAQGDITTLDPADRLKIVRDQIFGCDIDPVAVASLRHALIDRIGAADDAAREVELVVSANIRVGDALTGREFGARAESLFVIDDPTSDQEIGPAIDWGRSFPSVAAAGGFDLVVGNPPYLRERDARELFERIAQSPFGRRWREARMDLWYYFAHRALDLLLPAGVLTFVVNSYWSASLGARKLIARFERETSLDEIELLGTQPLFSGVSGRHLIFRLRKKPIEPSSLPDITPSVAPRSVSPPGSPGAFQQGETTSAQCTIIPYGADDPFLVHHVDLYQSGRLVLSPPVGLDSAAGPIRPLGDLFETRQGIAENPPAINRRLMRTTPGGFVLGEGVFVLTPEEVARLELSESERELLRPYYDTSAIGRYHLPAGPTHQILYLTRQTAPSLEGLPRIQIHLERFRSILDRRRETQNGNCAWWHLHWPREESNFLRPRLASVQMGRRPQFVFATQPTFVGFSVNLVLVTGDSTISLAALAGVLNSDLARNWFDRHAKRRGVHVEINAHVLRQFPLPAPDTGIDSQIAACVETRQACGAEDARSDQLEAQIERLVERWYRLPTTTSADGRTSSTP